MSKILIGKNDADAESEESDDDTYTSEGRMPKILIIKHDVGIKSEESDDNLLTSEDSMPKLLIIDKSNNENSCEKIIKWEILSET